MPPAAPAVRSLPAADFDFLCDFIKRRSGLALTREKEYLLEGRLLPLARQHGATDLSGLVALLRGSTGEPLKTEIVEAMTTNESLFFRDGKPFEYLRSHLLPELRAGAGGRRSLRFWSAACSTGQEPYSLAITLRDDPGGAGWTHEIMATDLARKVIDKAENGIYTQFEAQRGLSIQLLVKHFDPQPDTTWKIKPDLRAMVQFRAQNLLEDFSALGKFDVILCRNVLIYFDEPTKVDIIRRMMRQLNPGGALLLGGTEGIMDNSLPLTAIADCRGAYRLK